MNKEEGIKLYILKGRSNEFVHINKEVGKKVFILLRKLE